jgi:hypothetical protein
MVKQNLTVDVEPTPTIFLDYFTAIRNTWIDDLMELNLDRAEILLCLMIHRYTSGWQQEFCSLGESKMIELMRVCRSAFYAAKASLIKKGIIVMVKLRGFCKYALGERYRVLLRKGEQTLIAPKKAKFKQQVRPAGGHGSTLLDPCKEDIDILKQQHATLAQAEPKTNVDEVQNKYDHTRLGWLVDELKESGVHEFRAWKLAKKSTTLIVETAIARAKISKPDNPGAAIATEIEAGGYGRLPARTAHPGLSEDATQNHSLQALHEKIHHLRQAERASEELERERSSEKVGQAVDRFAQLPPTTQQQVLNQVYKRAYEEKFTKMRGWGESHPAFRGLLAEVMAQVMALDGIPQRLENSASDSSRLAS